MTYTEKTWSKVRAISVDGDILHISIKKIFGGGSKMSFDLKNVKFEPDVHYIKDDTRMCLVGLPGLIVFMIGAFGGTVIYANYPVAFYSIMGVGLTAMIAGFIFGGKVKVYLFKSQEEIGLFDVTGRGNRAEVFESFVGELKHHIQSLQSGQ